MSQQTRTTKLQQKGLMGTREPSRKANAFTPIIVFGMFQFDMLKQFLLPKQVRQIECKKREEGVGTICDGTH